MNKKYETIAFSPEGEYITEGEFESKDEAWERINDWGSRWIFYPITGVLKNKRVVEMCDGLEFLSNKDIKTIQKYLRRIYKRKMEMIY